MSIGISIVFAVILFSFLIVTHELGHFLAAKLFGVQVNEFSVFMGPAIFKRKGKETMYSIRCIPFGGYCAMEGEDEDSDNPRAFGAAAWWKRLIILVMGATMNFITGLALVGVLFSQVKSVALPVIAEFEPQSLVTGENGLQVGDEILKIDGERVYTTSDISILLGLNSGDVHDLVVKRGGEVVTMNQFHMPKCELVDKKGNVYQGYGFTLQTAEANFGVKLQQTWNTTVDYVRLVRLSLKMLFTGQAGIKDMAGPVGIVQQMSAVAGEAEKASEAFLNLLNLGALIAVNLAVMNLLPIPALDGGRAVCLLLTTAAEKITGKKINPKYEAYLHGIGMIILLAFMALITFKDVFTIFKG